ncbi:MAG TPA: phage Gp37/Gp68 family protein [Arenicellales bacterium]|nr:phage Gp37/Gp68 family protein [Arenicellales bacterium]
MSDKSHIEWTEATWNPVTGCTKVSQGCKHCYAERDWKRLAANPTARAYFGRKFTDVQCHPERLDQPLRWRNPRRIFVNSMSDLFHEDVPKNFIDRVFAVMALSPQHTFQVLTKRPERMREYLGHGGTCIPIGVRQAAEIMGLHDPGPMPIALPNVWLGVSVEDQTSADERIPPLLETPAAVRFLSCEPLLGPINLCELPGASGIGRGLDALSNAGVDPGALIPHAVDWVIAGGESGPRARPMHPDWVRSLRDQCQAAGVPFFFKQWGEWAPDCIHDGPACAETPRPSPGKPGCMFRCGKKRAGRQLDGRIWDEAPT